MLSVSLRMTGVASTIANVYVNQESRSEFRSNQATTWDLENLNAHSKLHANERSRASPGWTRRGCLRKVSVEDRALKSGVSSESDYILSLSKEIRKAPHPHHDNYRGMNVGPGLSPIHSRSSIGTAGQTTGLATRRRVSTGRSLYLLLIHCAERSSGAREPAGDRKAELRCCFPSQFPWL